MSEMSGILNMMLLIVWYVWWDTDGSGEICKVNVPDIKVIYPFYECIKCLFDEIDFGNATKYRAHTKLIEELHWSLNQKTLQMLKAIQVIHLVYKIKMIKLFSHKIYLYLTQPQRTPQNMLVQIDQLNLALFTNLQWPPPIHTINDLYIVWK